MSDEQNSELFDGPEMGAVAPEGTSSDTTPTAPGAVRVLIACRDQVEFRPASLDELLEAGHPARAVWAYVEKLDLRGIYATINAVEGGPGRPAIDPKILMALWLYATVEGVGSARALERLSETHDAYRWIRGGVGVNHHTLSDFRTAHAAELDRILSESVASMMKAGLVELKRVAQDGIRVRASAGAPSFRREQTLKQCLRNAREQVELLKAEIGEDPAAGSRRQEAARKRAAEDREERVRKAIEQLPQIAARREKNGAKKRRPGEDDEAYAKRTEPRASTTDPEARVMKMADGGFRPAYNGQFATDTKTQVIVGVDVSTSGSDLGNLAPMVEQLEERYGVLPAEVLVDGGFASLDGIDAVAGKGIEVYAPVMRPRGDGARDPHQPLPGDKPSIAAWRVRMGQPEAQIIYRERAASAECVNAQVRRRGLQQFSVRGIEKVRAVLLWHALTHNMLRAVSLKAAPCLGT